MKIIKLYYLKKPLFLSLNKNASYLMENNLEKGFLNSNETMKYLKISSCELMHFRLQGKLNFKKKGNAFYYKSSDVLTLNKLNA